MHRYVMAAAALLMALSASQAHFIWILPEGGQAKLVFSEQLGPDEAVDVAKVASTKLFAAGDAKTALTMTKGDHVFVVTVPSGCSSVAGTCAYGVLARAGSAPFMLYYHPKATFAGANAAKTQFKLPFELCFVNGSSDKATFQLTNGDGKPCANCEVKAIATGVKEQALTTNTEGLVDVTFPTPGIYGIRARLIEKKDGEFNGMKYEEVRHYATLVFDTRSSAKGDKPAKDGLSANPEATKLLAEARAARATWKDFPGFDAKIAVNFDGIVAKGTVSVDEGGKVVVEGLDDEAKSWARRTLASIVSHRNDGGRTYDTPCAFADNVKDHPLGRLIHVLNDELHSSYRIKDSQIMVVNRESPEAKFSITVQENLLTPEKKYLSSTFVVHYWDPKTGELQKTETNLQKWTRVGAYDLPAAVQIIYGDKNVSAKELTLSGHQLRTR